MTKQKYANIFSCLFITLSVYLIFKSSILNSFDSGLLNIILNRLHINPLDIELIFQSILGLFNNFIAFIILLFTLSCANVYIFLSNKRIYSKVLVPVFSIVIALISFYTLSSPVLEYLCHFALINVSFFIESFQRVVLDVTEFISKMFDVINYILNFINMLIYISMLIVLCKESKFNKIFKIILYIFIPFLLVLVINDLIGLVYSLVLSIVVIIYIFITTLINYKGKDKLYVLPYTLPFIICISYIFVKSFICVALFLLVR